MRQDIDEIYTRLDDEQSERAAGGWSLNSCIGGSTAGSDYRVTSSGPQETGGDYRDAGSRLQETGIGPAKGPAQLDAPEEAGSSS
ncbi:hypothetical protein Tco_0013993 [Tanacetum coccineum]